MPKEINPWAMYPRKTSPSPLPETPSFEAKFARMQYARNRRFHLSFMHYTGQWIQIYTDLTVDERIETVRDDPYFAM